MDPNATLKALADVLAELDTLPGLELTAALVSARTDLCLNLAQWLAADGFEPDWEDHREATEAFYDYVADPDSGCPIMATACLIDAIRDIEWKNGQLPSV